MDDIKYLKEQTSALINLYNAKIFDEVVRKGKLLIKKFPNLILQKINLSKYRHCFFELQ